MMIIMKLASLAVILLGLLPSSTATAAIRGAQKSTTTTTTTTTTLRELVVVGGSGISPAQCTASGATVAATIALGVNAVIYLCDGFFYQPTFTTGQQMGQIKKSQKLRIVCLGTCTIDGSLKPNTLPREVFEVRTGGVLQMYGVDVVNFAESRVVDANGVGCVVSYASCKLQNNTFVTVTGQLGGTTEVENGATGLALGSRFIENGAFSGGGAIRVQGAGSTLVLKGSLFNANTAQRFGGALHIQNADLPANPIQVYINKSSFENNGGNGESSGTTRSGGAIWSNRNAKFKIAETLFLSNQALASNPAPGAQGGALFIGGDSVLTSAINTYASNVAFYEGNHIFITNGANYFGCETDTFDSPDTDTSTSVVTSTGPFGCEIAAPPPS